MFNSNEKIKIMKVTVRNTVDIVEWFHDTYSSNLDDVKVYSYDSSIAYLSTEEHRNFTYQMALYKLALDKGGNNPYFGIGPILHKNAVWDWCVIDADTFDLTVETHIAGLEIEIVDDVFEDEEDDNGSSV